MGFSLEAVFNDILIRVLCTLPLKDVLSIRQVNTTQVPPLLFHVHKWIPRHQSG